MCDGASTQATLAEKGWRVLYQEEPIHDLEYEWRGKQADERQRRKKRRSKQHDAII